MRITESQLRRVIKNILVEYGTGPEFDHLRTEQNNLTDLDMKKIAQRFCNFLLKQSEIGISKYETFQDVSYRENDATFDGGKSIIVNCSVESNTWQKVQKEDRYGRVRYSDEVVSLFKGPWSGINLDVMFAGTKYLKNLRTDITSNIFGQNYKKYRFTILLHWPMWDEPEKQKKVFQELKEWLDKNENRKFTREDFGFPQIKEEYL